MSNLANHREVAVNMGLKQQKRLAIARELMEDAKERIDLSYELEQNLKVWDYNE